MRSEPENLNELARQWVGRLRGTDIADPQWEEAVGELRKLGFFVVPILIEAWGDDSMAVRRGISRALHRMGPRVVCDLIRAVEHEDPRVRHEAVSLLYGVAQKEELQIVDIMPMLIRALDDPESRVRKRAAQAMTAYRKNAEEAVPVLIRGLSDPEPVVRAWMAMALAAIDPPAEPVIPALTKALQDQDCEVRIQAARALAKIGNDKVPMLSRADLEQLIGGLKDTSEYERRRSAEALGVIGPAAGEAAAALTEALLDEDCEVRVWAAGALCKIDWEDETTTPMEELLQALRAPDEEVRKSSAMALASLGSAGSAAVLALTEALLDKSCEVRFLVARALFEIGADEVPILEKATLRELILGLKDPDAFVREWSAASLDWIGPAAREAVPALTEALLDDSPDVREAASDALDSIHSA